MPGNSSYCLNTIDGGAVAWLTIAAIVWIQLRINSSAWQQLPGGRVNPEGALYVAAEAYVNYYSYWYTIQIILAIDTLFKLFEFSYWIAITIIYKHYL